MLSLLAVLGGVPDQANTGQTDYTGASVVAGEAVQYTVTLVNTGDAILDNQVTSATIGSTRPAGGTDPGCSVQIAVTPTSITLVDLTSTFTLTGKPDSTVRDSRAVTMTVITNSFDGHTVTVRAASPELTSDQPGNDSTIPIGNLRVRESGTSAFQPLSTTVPVLVHDQPVASAPDGDAIGTDFEAYIPFVQVGTYSGTLTYVATVK